MLRLELTEYSDDRMALASLRKPKLLGYFFLFLALVADLSAVLLYTLYSFAIAFPVIILTASLLPIWSGLSILTASRSVLFDRKSETLTLETKNIFHRRTKRFSFSEVEAVRLEPILEGSEGGPPRSVEWSICLSLSDGSTMHVNSSTSKNRMYDLAATISKFLGKGAVERLPHFVYVADADEVLPGGRKLVQVGEDSIVIFNIGGAYYAIHNSCPHQGWPLVHGHLDGEVLTCSLHNWRFNLKDGSSPLSDDIRARVYPTKVEGSRVMIAI